MTQVDPRTSPTRERVPPTPEHVAARARLAVADYALRHGLGLPDLAELLAVLGLDGEPDAGRTGPVASFGDSGSRRR